MADKLSIFDRRCRVTVDGFAVEGLRVGFTINKDLTRRPNHAEIIVYNLARTTRDRFHARKRVPVVVEAGYRDTGLILLFAGQMREAFSRPERDGSWATILRAGDGEQGLRSRRATTSTRPGLSVDRVVKETFGKLQVGAGNLWQAIKEGKGIGEVFQMGFSGAGSAADQFDTAMNSQGLEWSVQDGELQVIPAGQYLATEATILSPTTGLEGTPEVDPFGEITCRARIVPGLSPGYPLRFATNLQRRAGYVPDWQLSALVRIEKTRYVGDTWGEDWAAEITCIDPRLAARRAAVQAAAKAATTNAKSAPAVTP